MRRAGGALRSLQESSAHIVSDNLNVQLNNAATGTK
jgi:hypothetical protein